MENVINSVGELKDTVEEGLEKTNELLLNPDTGAFIRIQRNEDKLSTVAEDVKTWKAALNRVNIAIYIAIFVGFGVFLIDHLYFRSNGVCAQE